MSDHLIHHQFWEQHSSHTSDLSVLILHLRKYVILGTSLVHMVKQTHFLNIVLLNKQCHEALIQTQLICVSSSILHLGPHRPNAQTSSPVLTAAASAENGSFFVAFFVKWHPPRLEALDRGPLHQVIRAHRPLPVLRLPHLKGLGLGIWEIWPWNGTIAQ